MTDHRDDIDRLIADNAPVHDVANARAARIIGPARRAFVSARSRPNPLEYLVAGYRRCEPALVLAVTAAFLAYYASIIIDHYR